MVGPRLAAGRCLWHGNWSWVSQRSSRTGCACLQRSRDVDLPPCHAALLPALRVDTRISQKPSLVWWLPVWGKPPPHRLRAAGDPGSQHPGPSTDRSAFVWEKADVTHAEELVMWEKVCWGIKRIICPAPSLKREEEGEDLGLPPQPCPCVAVAAWPLSTHYCLVGAMPWGAEATPGPSAASTKPLYGDPSEQGFARYLTDVSCSLASSGGAVAAALRRRWGGCPLAARPPWGCSRPGSPGAVQSRPSGAPLCKSVTE